MFFETWLKVILLVLVLLLVLVRLLVLVVLVVLVILVVLVVLVVLILVLFVLRLNNRCRSYDELFRNFRRVRCTKILTWKVS